MWKIFVISGLAMYIYLLICSRDIEREFIRRYDRKPAIKQSFARRINSLLLCFIPVFNIIMFLTIIFCYDEIVEKTIQVVLNRESYNI